VGGDGEGGEEKDLIVRGYALHSIFT